MRELITAAKEYLGQVYRIDERINAKLEQVMALRSLAAKATATLSDMPRPESPNHSRMEDIILKIIGLENEINADIDRLVDLKRKVGEAINALGHPEYQTLLELRYLCFKSWCEICVALGYGDRYVFKVHGRALEAFAKNFLSGSKRH